MINMQRVFGLCFVAASFFLAEAFQSFPSAILYPNNTVQIDYEEMGKLGYYHAGPQTTVYPNHTVHVEYAPIEPISVDSSFSNPGPIMGERTSHRRRRSYSHDRTMELMIVVDQKMKQHYGNKLENYVYTIVSYCAQLFKSETIGSSVNLAVVNFHVLDRDQEVKTEGETGHQILRNFCAWQKQRKESDPSLHYDAAVFMTRDPFCKGPNDCGTLGIAPIQGMCTLHNGCTIVTDTGLAAAFTMAHEIGHLLSINHDGTTACTKEEDQPHLMAPFMMAGQHSIYTWSPCSRRQATNFFDKDHSKCLLDKPQRNLLAMTQVPYQRVSFADFKLPGQLYSAEEQCALAFGPDHKVCDYKFECTVKWCMNPEGGCKTAWQPWADGTPCENGNICYKGQCVHPHTPHRVVHGGWSQWSSFDECSRSCGGGVQKATRECNNPKPENGGQYCLGERVRYRSCNTQECPKGAMDFREQQCAEFNGQKVADDVPIVTNWKPYFYRDETECRLHCNSEGFGARTLKEKVIDGTTCKKNTFDICVNGVCKQAGCDHVLGSNKVLDICGVCGGRGDTCRKVEQVVDVLNKEDGYHPACEIPVGASHINVRLDPQNDRTYLALRVANGEYIINGHRSIMREGNRESNGVEYFYSGFDAKPQLMKSKDPAPVRLSVELLIGGDGGGRVTCQYYLPN